MAQPLLDDALWARLEPLLPKPVAVRGDAADGPTSCRATVATTRNHIVMPSARSIVAIFCRRRTSHGRGLGVFRWVVERTLAWLDRFRRLAVRYERHDRVHHAFLTLGCALICWNYLKSTGRVF